MIIQLIDDMIINQCVWSSDYSLYYLTLILTPLQIRGLYTLSNVDVPDSGNYGCAVEYPSEDKTSSIESSYVTVLAACGVLPTPDNGALQCDGTNISSDRTCQVNCYPNSSGCIVR